MRRTVVLTLALIVCSAVFAGAKLRSTLLSGDYPDGHQYMGIRMLGTLVLPRDKVDGLQLGELSALAWDKDEQQLLILSNYGDLFRTSPTFNDQGTLETLNFYGASKLLDKKGGVPPKYQLDSEGLVLMNSENGRRSDTTMLVAFEGRPPRIQTHDQHGLQTGSIKLPAAIANANAFRNPNTGLESVALHPTLGILTAPELPVAPPLRGMARIYDTQGNYWLIPQEPLPDNAIVALEAMPDGDIMLLERSFDSFLKPIVITIRRVSLIDSCKNSNSTLCPAITLARFDSSQGWNIDNFEGLTRVDGNRYLIVSDNNNFWLQRNLLTAFEAVDPRSASVQLAEKK